MRKLQRLFILIIFIEILPALAIAQAWNAPAAELANRIAVLAGNRTISLTIKNASSIPQDQIASISQAIESQLRSVGMQIQSPGAAANDIAITLSENIKGWIWVAEVHQGSKVQVAIVNVRRMERTTAVADKPVMSVHRMLLMERPEPILDAAVVGAGSEQELIVLGVDTIKFMRASTGEWIPAKSLFIPHTNSFPRDVRGRLIVSTDRTLNAYLPGVSCTVSAEVPISTDCHESDDPWPIGTQQAFFNSARNYFTGVLPGMNFKTAPFYAAAALPRDKNMLWIFTGIDGQAMIFDGTFQHPLSGNTRDWGSDIAGLRSTCGLGMQLLVTGTGDDTAGDTLRLFEFADIEPVQVSSPVDFDGPVTALWPSQNGDTATAIVHNMQTGLYEAFGITVACNHQ